MAPPDGQRYRVKVGIGKDCCRFLPPENSKPCVIAGLIFEDTPGFAADSDGDVVFHAICNAITSLSGIPILDGIAVELCHKNGITDSQVYLEKALESLGTKKIEHVALTVEGNRPKLQDHFLAMRQNIATVLNVELTQVGFTATLGAGLTDFGCGEGVQCLCILTVSEF